MESIIELIDDCQSMKNAFDTVQWNLRLAKVARIIVDEIERDDPDIKREKIKMILMAIL